MDLRNNILFHSFMDDMMDVGLLKWGGMLVFFIFWIVLNPQLIPFDRIIAGIMALNMLMATVATAWWQFTGREKYALTDVENLKEALIGDS